MGKAPNALNVACSICFLIAGGKFIKSFGVIVTLPIPGQKYVSGLLPAASNMPLLRAAPRVSKSFCNIALASAGVRAFCAAVIASGEY